MKDQDKGLTDRVQSILDADQDLSGYDVRALARNGVIYLEGIVDVLAEKWRASQLASQIAGVEKIDNAITISTDGQINDKSVEFEVAEELNADPRVQLKDVEIVSKQGTVHLKGKVRTLSEAHAAVSSAAKSRGVKQVVNQLVVQSEVDDATITNQVEEAFGHQQGINPYLISTKTKNGHVHLHGTANNRFMKEFAAEIAARVPGVKKISNHLSLEDEPES